MGIWIQRQPKSISLRKSASRHSRERFTRAPSSDDRELSHPPTLPFSHLGDHDMGVACLAERIEPGRCALIARRYVTFSFN